jgi:flagellar basal-body rod protein FlgF
MAIDLLCIRPMDLLASAAASGLRSRSEALEMLANNIANAQTTGFKIDRELYSQYRTDEAQEAQTGLHEPSLLTDIDNHWTDFAQGPLQLTGNDLDLALQGRGFFVVEAPLGGPVDANRFMTRDGHFRLSPTGRLETSDGYAVLGYRPGPRPGERLAEPITVDPRGGLEVGRDGSIRQGGAVVAQLLLTEPGNPQLLPKRSGNYFSLDPRYLEQAPRQVEVQQGKLEGANFSPAEGAVRLVNVMRQFETLQRALQMGGEMNRRAVEDVARVV